MQARPAHRARPDDPEGHHERRATPCSGTPSGTRTIPGGGVATGARGRRAALPSRSDHVARGDHELRSCAVVGRPAASISVAQQSPRRAESNRTRAPAEGCDMPQRRRPAAARVHRGCGDAVLELDLPAVVSDAIGHVLCVQRVCVDGKHLDRVGLQSSLAEGRAPGGGIACGA